MYVFFFFQVEDGIRDKLVTGVQTCALPISGLLAEGPYQTFLAVAVFTMLLTPFLLEAGAALVDRIERVVPLDRLLPGVRPGAIAAGGQPLTDHVIIAGDRLNGRHLAAALRTIPAPYP